MADTTGKIPHWLIGTASGKWYSYEWFNRYLLLRIVFWIGFISIVIGGAGL